MKMKRLIAFTLLVCIFLMMPVSQVFAMQVNIEVEYDGNGILALDVEETDTIESVKSMILDNTGVSIDEQILVFNDQVLENSKTLQDYSITDGTLIKLAGPYSVTFIGNGYAQDTTITVKYGSMVELPSPEWDGVTFEGWYTDEECKKAFDPQTAIKTDTILYSKWKEIYCTVSFDNNGIGSETKPVQVRYGMQLEEYPEPPVAEGYVFDRWCADKDGSWFNPNSYITEDITLYAQWAVNAENTITIDNITFHFDNYPVPDQPLTTAGIYFDAGENTSLLSLDVPSWSEWDYYAFDENRLPVNECKMSEDSDSVTHFRAGKYYMYWCRISTPYSMGTMSIAVPPVVCSLDTTLNINCPNLMDYQCWPWAGWTDPETGEMSALVLEVAIVFKAPEYEVIEDEITDTTFEQGTDDVVVLHFNGDISLFDELIIDGNVVPKDQYTLTEGSTIVTLKASYLETLEDGDHTVTAVYNTNILNEDNVKDEVSTVITVVKSEDKPAEPDVPSAPGESAEPAPESEDKPAAENEEKPAEQENTSAPEATAVPVNTYSVPNTGDTTSITGYLVSGALSLVGIVGAKKKKR